MIRRRVCGGIAIVFMKKLQHLPEARDKGGVVRDGWIGLEERDQAAAYIVRRADQTDELLHVRHQFLKTLLSDEGIEHLSARLTTLTKEAWIVRGAEFGFVL